MKKREQVDSIHTSYLTDIVLKLWILIKNVLSLLIDRYLDSIHASSSPLFMPPPRLICLHLW